MQTGEFQDSQRDLDHNLDRDLRNGRASAQARAHSIQPMAGALPARPNSGETLLELAHDARNMVSALGIYCDLLEEPGVLTPPYAHYGHELRLVVSASLRLVEKLAALNAEAAPLGLSAERLAGNFASFPDASLCDSFRNAPSIPRSPVLETGFETDFGIDLRTSEFEATEFQTSDLGIRDFGTEEFGTSDRHAPVYGSSHPGASPGAAPSGATPLPGSRPQRSQLRSQQSSLISRGDSLPPLPVADLAAEVAANRNLLCALAGPAISLTVDAVGAALPVRLSGEDLTRVLVNLVKNAAEAMPDGGRIHIELRERAAAAGGSTCLMLAIEDSGPGIPGEAGEQIFDRGFTTHGKGSGNEASPGSGRPENAKNGKPANGNPPNGQSPENGLGPDDAWPFSHRGLGLAITRSIVEASGGHICAVIPCEGGARFEIELPLRHDTAPMAACSS